MMHLRLHSPYLVGEAKKFPKGKPHKRAALSLAPGSG